MSMEGSLCMPPDRGAILGRAQWKLRHVRIGKPPTPEDQPRARLRKSRSTVSGGIPAPVDSAALSVYRTKDDGEPLHTHAISLVHECQIQMLAHRKHPPEPTLVITFLLDPAIDRARKRRSSRTAGLSSSKDSGPPTLWFRAAPVAGDRDGPTLQTQSQTTLGQRQEDPTPSLYEWMCFIQQLVQPTLPHDLPMTPMSPAISPATPVSPTFVNPFASRQRGPSDPMRPRPLSRNSARNPAAQQYYNMSSVSQATYASVPVTAGRERPVTFSATGPPSLHSKCSDLSSHASSINRQAAALPAQPHHQHHHHQHHHHHHHQQHQQSASVVLGGFHHVGNATIMGPRPSSASERVAKCPADLPSPISTDQGDVADTWAPSHGQRPSALGSAPSTRAARDSIGSQPAPGSPSRPGASSSALSSELPTAGSFPNPRETILDRAFQLRCIPGAERETPGEEKLSSLVRFEALMSEMDEKRKQKAQEAGQARARAVVFRETAKRVQAAATATTSDSSRNHQRRPDENTDSSLRSVWDLDTDSSTDSASLDGGPGGVKDMDDSGDGHDEESGDAESLYALDRALEVQLPNMISPTTQRALEFVAGRRPSHARSPSSLSFTQEALQTHASSMADRPHTSRTFSGPLNGRHYQTQIQLQVRRQQQHHYQEYGGGKPGATAQRTLSQPQLAGTLKIATPSSSLPFVASGSSPISAVEDGSKTPIAPNQHPSHVPPSRPSHSTTHAAAAAGKAERRMSNSLTDFARRMSGTNSALSM